MMEQWNQSPPDPGLGADGTPCTVLKGALVASVDAVVAGDAACHDPLAVGQTGRGRERNILVEQNLAASFCKDWPANAGLQTVY